MRVILAIISIISILLINLKAVATPTPPIRQIRNAIVTLNQTETGRSLLTPFQSKEYSKLFDVLSFEDVNPHRLYEVNVIGDTSIHLNANFLEASPAYLSWLLAQALTEYKIKSIAAKHEVYDLPYFYQFSVWSFVNGAKHWSAMGSPNEYDFIHEPDSISWPAKELDASVSKYDQLYSKGGGSFYHHVIDRHQKLGFTIESLIDYANKATGKNKLAADDLVKSYSEDVQGLNQ